MAAPTSRTVVLLAALAHVLITASVWRDIGSRPSVDLRGSKSLWQAVTALNTGNCLIYLAVGRRRSH
jgi:hypothetical protein